MTRLLIISFSPLVGDARVLKQIAEFSADYELITCGYGPAPEGSAEHIRIPDEVRVDDPAGKLITLRQYRLAYESMTGVRWFRRALRGRTFDIVIANDVETVPLALSLKPRLGVHADLHEYSPSLHEEFPSWKRWISPYLVWLCRRSLPRAASVTTVSTGLQREYERRFGITVDLVTNAAPFVEAAPTPVARPLRLVHSGAGLRNRALHETVEGVMRTSADVTLDLYLTPNDPKYLAELAEMAKRSDGRVRLNAPVPYAELPETLRQFDVGVFVLRPVNFSYRWSLPNKLFDYIQARLAVVVGPTPEMAQFVENAGLGVVTDDFSPESLARTLDALTPEDVVRFKAVSHAQAHALSAEPQIAVWRTAVDRLRDSQGARR